METNCKLTNSQLITSVNKLKFDMNYTAVFENHLILENIFSNISKAADLKHIRLVSRLWKEISLDQWRRTATIRLLWKQNGTGGVPSPSSCNFCDSSPSFDRQLLNTENDPATLMNLSEFLKLMKNSKAEDTSCPTQLWRKPFSRYRIENCSMFQWADWEDTNLEGMWNMCGPQIKYLNLDHVTIHGGKFFEAFRWILSERLPNLEELAVRVIPTGLRFSIGDPNRLEGLAGYKNVGFESEGPALKLKSIRLELCRDSEREATRQISEHFARLLNSLPNIKDLKVDSKAFKYFRRGALQNPTVLGHPIKLRSLTFPVQESVTMYSFSCLKDYMTTVRPPLETLKIGVDLSRTEWRTSFQEFLASCQDPLQHLELRSHPMAIRGKSLSSHLENLIFPHITKLYLLGEAVISFKGLRSMPNLRTLWIQTDNCVYDWNQRMAQEEAVEEKTADNLLMPKLNNLYLDYYRLTPNSLRILGKWMPNLKKVQLILHKSTKPIVSEAWPELEEVTGLRGSFT